jgi:hypothetical protein
MKKAKTVTRRDFLKGTAGILLASAIGATLPSPASAEEKSKVAIVRHSAVVDSQGKVRPDVVQAMLDDAVKALSGEKERLRAWQRYFKPSDVVGIKSNAWYRLPTPRELEEAIHRRLIETGIKEENLSTGDRGILSDEVFRNATALVNVRPLRTHHWAGVGTCLKNYIMFVPNPSAYHDNACSDLGKIWHLPIVKGKTRLNVLCALTPQFYGRGANFFDRRYVWPYQGLIVGIDPVAVDTVGAELLRLKRLAFFGEDRELDVPPIHIVAADKKYRLGVSDLSRIEIVRLGWAEGRLI